MRRTGVTSANSSFAIILNGNIINTSDAMTSDNLGW